MQRRPDRPCPDPQLATYDLDARDVRDVDATLKLFSNRTEQQLARGGDAPAEHGPERDPQNRGRAAARAQAMLGQGEGARVIDQVARNLDRTRDRVGDLHAVPMPGNVGDEPGDACGGFEDTGHADPDRLDALDVAGDGPCHLDQLPNHAPLAFARVGGQETCFDEARFERLAFDHGPLQVRPTHVETEV